MQHSDCGRVTEFVEQPLVARVTKPSVTKQGPQPSTTDPLVSLSRAQSKPREPKAKPRIDLVLVVTTELVAGPATGGSQIFL